MKRLFLALLATLFLALPAWAQFVELNTASQAELESLPGIGPAKAAAIIEYREGHGGFSDPNQLDDVPGIGAATLSRLLPLVTVDGTSATATSAAPRTEATTSASPVAYAATGSDDLGLAIQPAPDTPANEHLRDPSTQAVAPAGDRLDINTATASQLDSLPGIGPSKAQAIVSDRDQNGPFSSCADLQRVTGIGASTVAKIDPLCTVGGGTAASAPRATAASSTTPAQVAPAGDRVNINSAGVSQLDSLPGIGPSKAQAIVSDRDQNGPFSSCADLQRVHGIGASTVAKLEALCTTQ